MLAEKVNWPRGNFVWSGYITAFTLFVAARLFWLRQIAPQMLATARPSLAAVCARDCMYLPAPGSIGRI